AASIAVLAIFVIESVCNRVRHVRGDAPKGAVETLRDCGAGPLAEDVEELFVVRDVVAHNHLWDATIADDDDKGLLLVEATLLPGYGDKKFNRVVDRATRRTRRLGLDVFPTRIHRHTAIVVLRKSVDVLRFLGDINMSFVGAAPWISWHGQRVPF